MNCLFSTRRTYACLLVVLAATANLALTAADTLTFTNPVAASGADPWVVQTNGAYYFCQSRGGRGVWVGKTARLEDLGRCDWAHVWSPPRGTNYSRELWAPELHYLRGAWYIYLAADDGDNANHRMFALKGTTQNPQDPFQFAGQLKLPDNRWAIDGTMIGITNQLYFVWSGWEGDRNVAQNLYIAAMKDPLTPVGPRVCISRPDHPWEQHGDPLVNEGPEALWHGSKLFLIYSASGSWGDDYCLGQLTWNGGDPLQPASWSKKPIPVFSRTPDVLGPGHCSFVKSPDGTQDWIVYHAAKYSGAGWNRNVRIQRFTWNPDGSPNFGTPVSPGLPLPIPSGPTRP